MACCLAHLRRERAAEVLISYSSTQEPSLRWETERAFQSQGVNQAGSTYAAMGDTSSHHRRFTIGVLDMNGLKDCLHPTSIPQRSQRGCFSWLERPCAEATRHPMERLTEVRSQRVNEMPR